MAKYTDLVIPRLRDLESKRYSLSAIPKEIESIKMRMTAIRSATTDSEPVKGGTNRREDALVGCIAEIDYLEKKLAANQAEVGIIDDAIAHLPPNERTCIERFFIKGERNAAFRLSSELGYEKSQVYRIKDEGLIRLSKLLYGVAEL